MIQRLNFLPETIREADIMTFRSQTQYHLVPHRTFSKLKQTLQRFLWTWTITTSLRIQCLILEQETANALAIWPWVEIDHCRSAMNETIFLLSVDEILAGNATSLPTHKCFMFTSHLKKGYNKNQQLQYNFLNIRPWFYMCMPHACHFLKGRHHWTTTWSLCWRMMSYGIIQVLMVQHIAFLVRHRNCGLYQPGARGLQAACARQTTTKQ